MFTGVFASLTEYPSPYIGYRDHLRIRCWYNSSPHMTAFYCRIDNFLRFSTPGFTVLYHLLHRKRSNICHSFKQWHKQQNCSPASSCTDTETAHAPALRPTYRNFWQTLCSYLFQKYNARRYWMYPSPLSSGVLLLVADKLSTPDRTEMTNFYEILH